MFLPSNITLQFGDSGDFVSELQRRLAMAKCFSEDMVNGFYDGNTVNGVTRFQAMVGLHADGVAGPETLRRLNGMVSSSGSTNTDKKEEEQARAATQHGLQMFFGNAPQQPDPAAWGIAPPQQEPQAPAQQPALQPEAQTALQPQPLQQQEQAKSLEQQHVRPPIQDPTLATAFTPLPQQRMEPPPVNPQQQSLKQGDSIVGAQANQMAPAEQKQEPKGLIGRAVKFASEYLQKLADYFESKLPPSVLNEVQSIGQSMARSGMRESPVPAGPELVQAPVTPARTAPQQQRV